MAISRVTLTLALLLAGSARFVAPAWADDSIPRQGAAPVAEPRPNVLVIIVDDLNDWIGALGGHPDVQTPHMDRLAQRGTLFRHAYAPAPSCNPSRTALLTGVRPSTSGVYHNNQPWRPVLPDVVTLPRLFMDHGYRVEGVGKVFHGHYPDSAAWHAYSRPGTPGPPQEVRADPRNHSGHLRWGPMDAEETVMGDHRAVSRASEFLAQERDQPFFLVVGIFRPHLPWYVPRRYFDLYPLDRIALPEVPDDELDDIPAAPLELRRELKMHEQHAIMLWTGNWRRAVQGYLASVSFADAQVGRLLDALDRSAHRDDTIVVLMSDHGFHLGEKHQWQKWSLWERATRIPLIVVAPGLTRAGTVSDRTVDLMHIYPTLADLAALPIPDVVEGVSLRPLLVDPKAQWDWPAVMTHGRNNHAIRTERWRYIRYDDGSEELYDHTVDPREWRNLAREPQYAETMAKLAEWLPKVNAPDAPVDPNVPATVR